MYKIERRASGYFLTFGGFIRKEEMQQWVEESRKALISETASFAVIVDMRTLSPLAKEVQEVMVGGQSLYKEKGMIRSSVIVNNAVTAMQFKRLAKTSGIFLWERYIDGSNKDCFDIAIAWARDGFDPDA